MAPRVQGGFYAPFHTGDPPEEVGRVRKDEVEGLRGQPGQDVQGIALVQDLGRGHIHADVPRRALKGLGEGGRGDVDESAFMARQEK